MNIGCESSNLKSALEYASLGYKVFPIHGFLDGDCTCCHKPCPGTSKPGKHPACIHGCHDGTLDEEKIKAFFDGQPWLNVGIAPETDTLVIDIDPAKGGSDTLARWIAEHGELPTTPKVQTGSKGFHYYFRLPPGVIVKNKSEKLGGAKINAGGVDTRSAGGYLVAPPSVHECGGKYAWIEPLTTPLAEAPDWLIAIVGESPTAVASSATDRLNPDTRKSNLMFSVVAEAEHHDFASHPGATEGQRRKECCRMAGIHIDRGDSLKTVEAMAIAWAARCNPPYGESEALTHVRGIFKKESAKRGSDGLDRNSEPVPEAEAIQIHPVHESSVEKETPEGESPTLNSSSSSSFLSTIEQEEVESEFVFSYDTESVHAPADDWPVLSPEAYHGLVGDIVRAITPETEADPVAVLLSLLTAFGNAIGSSPCFSMLDGDHYANIFTAIVGGTASGKGRSGRIIRRLMEKAEADWNARCIAKSLSSGEGFVHLIKDDGDAEEAGFFGSPEAKRLLVIESEFARTFNAMDRSGNTLSANLRSAWDHETLEVNTRGKNKLRASNAHVSVIIHCTPEELAKLMEGSMEIVNGFSNRFLWACTKRSNILPRGGNIGVIEPFGELMRKAIETAKGIKAMAWDDDAGNEWDEGYEVLTAEKPGAYGSSTQRAHAQTLRLSMLYALLDGSDVIRQEHLRAALAVWRYCEHSARIIFGGQGVDKKGKRGEAEEEALDFKLLMMIEAKPGIRLTDLRQATPSHKRGEVPEALASLQAMRLAHPRMEGEGVGRKAECWYPGPGPEPEGPGMKFTCSQEDGPEIPSVRNTVDRMDWMDSNSTDNASEPIQIHPIHESTTQFVDRNSDEPIQIHPIHPIHANIAEVIPEVGTPEAEAKGGTPSPPPLPPLSPEEQAIVDELDYHGFPPEESPFAELADNIHRKGMSPLEAFKAFGISVKTPEELEAEGAEPIIVQASQEPLFAITEEEWTLGEFRQVMADHGDDPELVERIAKDADYRAIMAMLIKRRKARQKQLKPTHDDCVIATIVESEQEVIVQTSPEPEPEYEDEAIDRAEFLRLLESPEVFNIKEDHMYTPIETPEEEREREDDPTDIAKILAELEAIPESQEEAEFRKKFLAALKS